MQHLDDIGDDELADLYSYPPVTDRAFVRANFVTTLDGSATGDDGRSASINDAADRRVFGLLRALSDVVLVGAGTVRAEGYRPVRTREPWQALRAAMGLAPHPTIAVVSRSLELPDELLTRTGDAGPVLVLSTSTADPRRAAQLADRLGAQAVLRAGRDRVDVTGALEQLGARGLRRVLLEGGPQLMGDVVRAGRLDELCLSISPQLVGGPGPRLADGPPLEQSMRFAHGVQSSGCLLTRWVAG